MLFVNQIYLIQFLAMQILDNNTVQQLNNINEILTPFNLLKDWKIHCCGDKWSMYECEIIIEYATHGVTKAWNKSVWKQVIYFTSECFFRATTILFPLTDDDASICACFQKFNFEHFWLHFKNKAKALRSQQQDKSFEDE